MEIIPGVNGKNCLLPDFILSCHSYDLLPRSPRGVHLTSIVQVIGVQSCEELNNVFPIKIGIERDQDADGS